MSCFGAMLLGFSLVLGGSPEDPGPYAAGYRRLTVPGVAGGNGKVELLLYYPATVSGANTPLAPGGRPYPLVVFGHGFSLTTELYDSLYAHLASRGFLVAGVATEEQLFTGNLPRFLKDFAAAVLGLRAEAKRTGGPLEGAVSPTALAGAAGHSFGGAAAIVAAADRPDLFGALVTMAATATSPQQVDILAAVRRLRVPALHLGASRDTIVPPGTNLDPIYAATPGEKRLLEIGGGTHSYFHERWGPDRLLEPRGQISVAEQQRLVRRYGLSFFEYALRDESTLLDFYLGPTAVADPGLSRQQVELPRALLFGAGTGRPGTPYRLHPARRTGDSGLILAAAAGGRLATTFGELLLDPATLLPLGVVSVGSNAYGTYNFSLPGDPALVGQTVHLQALLLAGVEGDLSNPWRLRVR